MASRWQARRRSAPFDLKECQRLNGQFEKLTGKSLDAAELKQLWELLGGQPYLTHQAIYSIVTNRVRSAKKLIAEADGDGSPFADHLRALLGRVIHRAEFDLARAFRQILAGDPAADRRAAGRLKAAGLVRFENNRPVPANQLYARFFRRML